MQQAVCDAVRQGMPFGWAARLAGVSDSAVSIWRQRGEADAAAGRATPYASFVEAVKNAEAIAIEANLRGVREAKHDWQKHAWILERRWPSEFGRRDAVNVEQSGNVRIVVEHVGDWHARDVIDVEPVAQAPYRRRGRELDGQPAT